MKRHGILHDYIWLMCCLFCTLEAFPQQDSNWMSQCEDMKRMLIGLDIKMASFENKLTEVKILEYAFKINNIDNKLSALNANMETLKFGAKDHGEKVSALVQDMKILNSRTASPASNLKDQNWEALNTRLDQMSLKMESMKDTIENLKPPDCPKQDSEPVGRHRNLPLFEQESNPNELMMKLDNYGRKLMESNQGIQEDGKQHRQDFNGLANVVRNGFNKVISKIDQALEMEGQITNVIRILQQVSSKTTSLADQIVSFLGEFLQVKGDVSESHQLLTNLGKSLNKSSETFPVADLVRAVEIGKELEPQITKFAALEGKIEKTKALSSQLVSTNKEHLSSDFQEVALNLSTFLNEIQDMSLPLFFSVPYNFQNLQAHVGDALSFLRSKTQCHSSQVIQLEVQRLKSGVQQAIDELRNSSKVGIKTAGIPSLKEAVFQTLYDLQKSLREVNSRKLFWSNNEERKELLVSCAVSIVKKYREKVGGEALPEDDLIAILEPVCEISYLVVSVF